MASIESRIIVSYFKLTKIKKSFQQAFKKGNFEKNNTNFPPKRYYSSLHINTTQINGKNSFELSPLTRATKTHILYLHGGAYVFGFNKIHWKFFAVLIKALNCTIIAPDYPLAPKFTFEDSFSMLLPIYSELVAKVGSENIILMGDSAGGGFALALAQKLSEGKIQHPSQIIMLSPWLDITLDNPAINDLQEQDPVLEKIGLKMAAKSYAGDTELSDYRLSPINGVMTGLGTISIFIGTKDILVADTRKFKAMFDDQGIDINYFEYKDMVHIWPLLGLPESKQAINQIIELIKSN